VIEEKRESSDSYSQSESLSSINSVDVLAEHEKRRADLLGSVNKGLNSEKAM